MRSTTEPAIRPEILAFARDMEAALKARDATRGDAWKGANQSYLLEKVAAKVGALKDHASDQGGLEIIVDLANYLLFYREWLSRECIKPGVLPK